MTHFDGRDNGVIILMSLLLVLTLVEMGFSYYEHRNYYNKRDTFTNIYLTVLTFLINLAMKVSTFFILNFVYRFRLFVISNTILYLDNSINRTGLFILGTPLHRSLLPPVLGNARYASLFRIF